MNPRCFIEQTFLFQVEISPVKTDPFQSVFVRFYDSIYLASFHTWHDDKSAPVELELTFKETRRAEQSFVMHLLFGKLVFLYSLLVQLCL